MTSIVEAALLAADAALASEICDGCHDGLIPPPNVEPRVYCDGCQIYSARTLIKAALLEVPAAAIKVPCCNSCPAFVRQEFNRSKGTCAGPKSPVKGQDVRAQSRACYQHPQHPNRDTSGEIFTALTEFRDRMIGGQRNE